jgi:hypothetical protein
MSPCIMGLGLCASQVSRMVAQMTRTVYYYCVSETGIKMGRKD